MIQERSLIKIADNSGAKVVRCFRVLGGTRRRVAGIGDIVVASVQTVEPRKKVKKKEIVRVLIVRTRNAFRRQDGSYVRFDENAAVIVDPAKKTPLGTRMFGPFPRELKAMGHDKLMTMVKDIV